MLMILPPGHHQQLSTAPRRNRRERWLIAVGGAMAAAIVAVILFSLTSQRPRNGNGCVSFTYAMVMGGEEFHACGAHAVKVCSSPPKLGGLGNDFEKRLALACREARIGPPATS